jgi:hypothetical protein
VPPTKYDNSVYIEHHNYDGAGYLVRKAREENPYVNLKMAAIDYRYWSVFHFKFYETVLNIKMKLIKMKWIDFTHLEDAKAPEKKEVLDLVDKYKMRNIMSSSMTGTLRSWHNFMQLSFMKTQKRQFTG